MRAFQRKPIAAAAPVRDTPLARADEQMVVAKQAFSAAALACLRREPGCEGVVRKALAAVDAARAQLARVSDDE